MMLRMPPGNIYFEEEIRASPVHCLLFYRKIHLPDFALSLLPVSKVNVSHRSLPPAA
jgi:hypothetical protein